MPGSGSSNPLLKTHNRYGAEHRRLRKQLRDAWQDGDPCARCGGPMRHDDAIDLDHTDDGTGYLGLSHASCNRSQSGRLHRVKREAVCDGCGIPFVTGSQYQRFCSRPCYRAARPSRPEPVLEMVLLTACKVCNKTFDPTYRHQVLCSADCRVTYKRRAACIRKRIAMGNAVDAPIRRWTRRATTK